MSVAQIKAVRRRQLARYKGARKKRSVADAINAERRKAAAEAMRRK